MVSNAEILPHEEVFNTYGENLSNAQLLVQYGFILDPNDNDTVNFDVNDIVRGPPLSKETWEIPRLDHTELSSHADLFTTSSLVFAHYPSDSETRFYINSDGKISHHLWIFLIKLLCRNAPLAGPSVDLRGDRLREIITAQMNLEDTLQDDRSNYGSDGPDALRSPLVPVLLEVARTVIRLCEMRKDATGYPGFANEDLGQIMDVGHVLFSLQLSSN